MRRISYQFSLVQLLIHFLAKCKNIPMPNPYLNQLENDSDFADLYHSIRRWVLQYLLMDTRFADKYCLLSLVGTWFTHAYHQTSTAGKHFTGVYLTLVKFVPTVNNRCYTMANCVPTFNTEWYPLAHCVPSSERTAYSLQRVFTKFTEN